MRIWFFTVCLCHTIRTLGLYGLASIQKKSYQFAYYEGKFIVYTHTSLVTLDPGNQLWKHVIILIQCLTRHGLELK